MAHDVFISYSSKDKTVADAICARLEAGGIRSWIAPRDIVPGSEWGAAIVEAIENARVMVLVFSSNANSSPQIAREVERAVNKGLAIIPFRIEDVTPERSLEYFLGTPHWLDAMSPPLENHLAYLVDIVGHILAADRERPLPPPRPMRGGVKPMTLAAIAGAIALVAVLALLLTRSGGGDDGSAGSGTQAKGPVDAAMLGSWLVDVARSHNYGGNLKKASWQIDANGGYKHALDFEETGQYTANRGFMELKADGRPGFPRPVIWKQTGDTTQGMSLEPDGVLSLAASYSKQAQDQVMFQREVEWKRASGGSGDSPLGVWRREVQYSGQTWRFSIEFSANGRYSAKASTEDTGKFFAENGKWHLASEYGGVADGDYLAIDANTMSLPRTRWGDMIWQRQGTTTNR